VAIDEEVRVIVDSCEERARGILSAETDTLHRLAGVLLEREVLDRDEIQAILEGRDPPPVKTRRQPKKPGGPEDSPASQEDREAEIVQDARNPDSPGARSPGNTVGPSAEEGPDEPGED
jgi:cell division protease FtsH